MIEFVNKRVIITYESQRKSKSKKGGDKNENVRCYRRIY